METELTISASERVLNDFPEEKIREIGFEVYEKLNKVNRDILIPVDGFYNMYTEIVGLQDGTEIKVILVWAQEPGKELIYLMQPDEEDLPTCDVESN